MNGTVRASMLHRVTQHLLPSFLAIAAEREGVELGFRRLLDVLALPCLWIDAVHPFGCSVFSTQNAWTHALTDIH